MKWLDTLFPPFVDPKREKPRDMLFVSHERPPTSTCLVAGAQHALVVLMVVVYVVIVGAELGMSEGELRGFVALQITVLGITTLLQGLKTRFSSGHLMVHMPSIISSTVFISIVAAHGLGAASGAFIVSGLLVIVLARFLPRLRKFLPPEVTGVLLVLLGIDLIEGGAERSLGLTHDGISGAATAVAIVCLGGIVGFSIWGGEKLRVLAVGVGVAAGLGAAVCFGLFGVEEMREVGQQPVFALPFGSWNIPTPRFVLAAIAPLLLIEIISAVDTIGMGVAVDKLNNGKWKRPDCLMLGRLVTCHGIGVFLNGIFGTLSSGISSANLGLAHATGVGARRVAVFAGGILIAVAFLPKVSVLIIQIPQPIRGAIIIYTAAYMLVSGMQLILSRMLNNRRMFLVGISICVGGAVILMPELTAHAPAGIKAVVGSGLTVGVVTAIILNMLFRIGISQTATTDIAGLTAGGIASEFLEDCGENWGARPDVISRAAVAVGEAMEAINGADLITGPAQLRATFDEYKLDIEIIYPGQIINLSPAGQINWSDLLDDEDDGDEAIDQAVADMSSHLIRNLADTVTAEQSGDAANLHMVFEH